MLAPASLGSPIFQIPHQTAWLSAASPSPHPSLPLPGCCLLLFWGISASVSPSCSSRGKPHISNLLSPATTSSRPPSISLWWRWQKKDWIKQDLPDAFHCSGIQGAKRVCGVTMNTVSLSLHAPHVSKMSNCAGQELLPVIPNVKDPRVVINSARKNPKNTAFVGFWRWGVLDCQVPALFSHSSLCTQTQIPEVTQLSLCHWGTAGACHSTATTTGAGDQTKPHSQTIPLGNEPRNQPHCRDNHFLSTDSWGHQNCHTHEPAPLFGYREVPTPQALKKPK